MQQWLGFAKTKEKNFLNRIREFLAPFVGPS
jgi:hypothetical protein